MLILRVGLRWVLPEAGPSPVLPEAGRWALARLPELWMLRARLRLRREKLTVGKLTAGKLTAEKLTAGKLTAGKTAGKTADGLRKSA